MSLFTRTSNMGLAALIMSLSIFASRFMGLARDKVISWQFGTSSEADVYFVAFVIPDFINYLLAGGYVSITLMPLLAKYFSPNKTPAEGSTGHMTQNMAEGWRFFSAIFWWALFAISFLTLLAWIFTDSLVPIIAPGFDSLQQERLALFLRIILPAQIFFVSGACFSAILFLRRQFYVPALTPLIYNGSIILCGLALPFFGFATGMEGFCVGVTLGAALGAWILPAWAVAHHGLTLHWCLSHPKIKLFLFIALPLMLGQSVVMLNEQFLRIFGSMAGEGVVSILSYARRLSQVPVGMIGQALAVASYPFLATMAAEKRMDVFYDTLGSAMRTSVALLLPMSAFLVAAALPVTGIIFEGGDFTGKHSHITSYFLQLMLLAVPFWGIQMVLGRAFYALGDTLTPALCGTAVTLISVPLFYAGVSSTFISGAEGITLVSLFGVLLYIYIIMYVWHKKHGHQSFLRLGNMLCCGIFSSALAGCLSYIMSQKMLFYTQTWHYFFSYFAALAGSFCVFAIVYTTINAFFFPQLLKPLKEIFLNK